MFLLAPTGLGYPAHGLHQRLESSIALFDSQLLHTLDEFHDKFQCGELLLRIKDYQLLTVRHSDT